MFSELRFRGRWNPREEMMHYLNGFVGVIEWLCAEALIKAPAYYRGTEIQKYRDRIRDFRAKLKLFVSKWNIRSLPPPHIQSVPPGVSTKQLRVFDKYIALRDTCRKRFENTLHKMGALFSRDNQDWNLLLEHIGFIVGYPGLHQRGFSD